MQASKSDLKTLLTLKKRKDFVLASKSGKKWVTPSFILQIRKLDDKDVDAVKSIGFTVSKKVHKSAVKRNRIKRRLRAVSADVLPQQAKPCYAYVFIGRLEALTKPYDQMQKDLIWALKRLDVYEEFE